MRLSRNTLVCYSFVCGFFSFPPLGSLHAALKVDKPEVTVTELNASDRAVVTFLLTNDGDSAIEISKVNTDCACLSYVLSNRFVKPGDKVKFWVEYGVKDGGGNTSHEIILSYRIKDVLATERIMVNVKIPVKFEISSRRLQWGTGDVNAQRVELKILKSSGVGFVRAQVYGSNPAAFNLLVSERDEIDSEYFYYDFTVTPTAPAALVPEKVGAVGFVGLELKEGDTPLKTLFEVISWPDE